MLKKLIQNKRPHITEILKHKELVIKFAHLLRPEELVITIVHYNKHWDPSRKLEKTLFRQAKNLQEKISSRQWLSIAKNVHYWSIISASIKNMQNKEFVEYLEYYFQNIKAPKSFEKQIILAINALGKTISSKTAFIIAKNSKTWETMIWCTQYLNAEDLYVIMNIYDMHDDYGAYIYDTSPEFEEAIAQRIITMRHKPNDIKLEAIMENARTTKLVNTCIKELSVSALEKSTQFFANKWKKKSEGFEKTIINSIKQRDGKPTSRQAYKIAIHAKGLELYKFCISFMDKEEILKIIDHFNKQWPGTSNKKIARDISSRIIHKNIGFSSSEAYSIIESIPSYDLTIYLLPMLNLRHLKKILKHYRYNMEKDDHFEKILVKNILDFIGTISLEDFKYFDKKLDLGMTKEEFMKMKNEKKGLMSITAIDNKTGKLSVAKEKKEGLLSLKNLPN